MLTKVTMRRFASGTRRDMGTNTNRKDGLRFENELCEMLAEYGWWAHDMTQSAAGQPADVIAVRCDTAVLIDCKVCARDKFQLSRIEPNQETAMQLWYDRGNYWAYFAVKMNDHIYMVHNDEIRWLKSHKVTVVSEEYCKKHFKTFGQWIDYMEDKI